MATIVAAAKVEEIIREKLREEGYELSQREVEAIRAGEAEFARSEMRRLEDVQRA